MNSGIYGKSRLWLRLPRRASAFALALAAVVITNLLPGTAFAGPANPAVAQSYQSSDCWMSVTPASGPVGTHVSIQGSNAGCGGAGSGYFVFAAEHATMLIGPGSGGTGPGTQQPGPFKFNFTVPSVMPSGNACCAALRYYGGGPLAPGMTTFAVYQGAPFQVNFDVTSTPLHWADYTTMAASNYVAGSVSNSGPAYHSGYYLFRSGGWVDGGTGGDIPGSVGGMALPAPIVGSALLPSGASPGMSASYLLAGANGSVYNFGNAHWLGSMAHQPLPSPVVAMAAKPDGSGYWLVTAKGNVYNFGTAHWWGSPAASSIHLPAPVVGITATATGSGYWLATANGGAYNFGSAQWFGSMAHKRLGTTVVSMVATPNDGGYWLLGANGGVFNFGNASWFGSARSGPQQFPAVSIARGPNGNGYWIMFADGGVFTYGDAPFLGSGR